MINFHSLKQIEVLDRNPLGEGAFSFVFKVRHRATNQIFALKKIDILQLSKADCQNLKLEIKLHKQLLHENIIKFQGCIQRKNMVYMLLEHAANGSLFFYIDLEKGLPEKLALRFLYETAKGIQYLHNKGVVHRDIKPENILLDKDFRVKVCDFGWSCEIHQDEDRSSICGTYEYMSPEIVYQQNHGFAVDVWCLGILLYEMLHGSPPFKAENLDQIKGEFRNKRLKINPNVDDDVVDLIKNLLHFDSKKRININDMLRHKAFQKNLDIITRPISQQEFKLLIKYYYLNSGGTNLDTHKKEFAGNYPRESELERRHAARINELTNSSGKVGLKEERSNKKVIKRGNNFTPYKGGDTRIIDDVNQEGKDIKFKDLQGNNFEPSKFKSPNDKGRNQKVFNDFQPNKFISPAKGNQDFKNVITKSGSSNNIKPSDDIKFYEPPKFISEKSAVKQNESRFKKKKDPVISEEKSNNITKPKFSGLKKKLQNQEKRNNSGAKVIKSKENSKFKTFGQILKDNNKTLISKKKKIENQNRPMQSRSMSLQKMLNTSLLSQKTTTGNQRIKLSNYLSNPSSSLSMNNAVSQYSSRSGLNSSNTSFNSRINRFKSKDKNLDDKNRLGNTKNLKRDTSQSIEKAMNIRVIKASTSLPKAKFLKYKPQGTSNTSSMSNTYFLKNQLKKNLQNKKILGLTTGFNSFREKKPDNKKPNMANYSSINYKADEVIPEELYLSQFQTVSDTKKVNSNVIKEESSENIENNREKSAERIKFGSGRRITRNFTNSSNLGTNQNISINKHYNSKTNVNYSKKTSISSNIPSKVLRNEGSQTSLNKVNVSFTSNSGITTHKRLSNKNSSSKTKLSKLSGSKDQTKVTTRDKILNNSENQKSLESFQSYYKQQNMFEDYKFNSSSQLSKTLSSQNFSKKEISSVNSINEKQYQSQGRQQKTRDIAFNQVSLNNSVRNSKTNNNNVESKNVKKLSDIYEESNTFKTHTSTLRDVQPDDMKRYSKTNMDIGNTEKKRHPRKYNEPNVENVNMKKKEPEKLPEKERVAPKYVKRVFYVNGVKKIQMILSKGINSPPRRMTQNMQEYLQENSNKQKSGVIRSNRSISITKKVIKDSNENTKKYSIQKEQKKSNEIGTQSKGRVIYKSQKSSGSKSPIQWINYNSPKKRINLDDHRIIRISQNKTINHDQTQNHTKESNMNKLLDKVQNLQTKNQETLAKKNRVILSKNEIPLKKNFKNYSYGIGDNLQKLISENRPKVNAVRFENSFLIPPEVDTRVSIKNPSQRDSILKMEYNQKSSAPRYSKTRISSNYNSEKREVLRQSMQFKGSDNEMNMEDGQNREERVSFLESKYRSNQWMNYDFIRSKERIKKNEEITSQNNPISPSGPVPRLSKNLVSSSNKDAIMTINIKQLPGLKESHSTGKLKMPLNVSHNKNKSIDISSKNLRMNSQFMKIIDSSGNVRYKFLGNSNNNEDRESQTNQYNSVHRGSYNPHVVKKTNVGWKKE